MINTYNESQLHQKLKEIYALENNGRTEVSVKGTQWICDIIDENENVIEIQTSNLSALFEKTTFLISQGRKVRIVHPIIEEKLIEMYDKDGSLLYRKKSPKKASLFDSLRGMTKICPLFLNENLSLEVLYVRAREIRRKTTAASQTPNKSRRHLKEWISEDKVLESILWKEKFSTPQDFLSLLAGLESKTTQDGRRESFRACDLAAQIKKARSASDAKWASLLIWILTKMGLLEIEKISGRSKFYRISGNQSAESESSSSSVSASFS